MVSDRAPGVGGKVFFTATGAVALESAVRMARALTGREAVIRSGGSDDDVERALATERPDRVAAVIVDSVGIVGSADRARECAEIWRKTAEHGVLYIADEIAGGFARTGHWFASEALGVVPDNTVFGEDLDSGLVGIGGVVLAAHRAAQLSAGYFSGVLVDELHPLAAAAAIASIELIESKGLLQRAADLGDRIIRAETTGWVNRHHSLRAVIGSGLRWRIELATEDEQAVAAFIRVARRGGVWPIVGDSVVLFAPSLTITEERLRVGVRSVGDALAAADRAIAHREAAGHEGGSSAARAA